MPTRDIKTLRSAVPQITEAADSSDPTHGRRGFLRTSANAGLLGAALALFARTAPVQASQQLAAPEKDPPSPSGYHETEHIRKYYAKARQF
jgi:hypothetical protein